MPISAISMTEFFRRYEQNSALDDADAIASQFAETFMVGGTEGTRMVTRQNFKAAIPQRKQWFRSIGCHNTRLVSLDETWLDEHYALVKTRWLMQFNRKDEQSEITVNSTFIVHQNGDSPKIVFYLPHEDIMSILREKGLLSALNS